MTYTELLAMKERLGKLQQTALKLRQAGLGKANEEPNKDMAHGQKQVEKPPKKPSITQPGVDASNLDNPIAS